MQKRTLGWLGALAGIVVVIIVVAPGELQSHCQVSGGFQPSRCTFTNEGVLPGRLCVVVTLANDNAGKAAHSMPVCSGLVWPSSTASADIAGFDSSPLDVCEMNFDNCVLEVARK